MENLNNTFLKLVRLGIGTSEEISIKFDVDWKKLIELADRQGLAAVILDGISRIYEEQRPPKDILLPWIGETLQNYDDRYSLYCHSIADMASFFHEHGLKMMVLKGYVCSLDWPKPEHRPCGDIDVWFLGQQKKADYLVSSECDIKVGTSEHHHTVFYWRGFMVENHFDFIDVHHRKLGSKIEAVLKELSKDDSFSFDIFGTKTYIPSPNLNALFLLYHLMLHFTSTEMSIRQILDWGIL